VSHRLQDSYIIIFLSAALESIAEDQFRFHNIVTKLFASEETRSSVVHPFGYFTYL